MPASSIRSSPGNPSLLVERDIGDHRVENSTRGNTQGVKDDNNSRQSLSRQRRLQICLILQDRETSSEKQKLDHNVNHRSDLLQHFSLLSERTFTQSKGSFALDSSGRKLILFISRLNKKVNTFRQKRCFFARKRRQAQPYPALQG